MEKLSRVGETYITNEGYKVKIIEYFNSGNCTIQFEDGTVIKNKPYFYMLRGTIKNSLHKSVCGVGYVGIGKYNKKTYTKMYSIWQGILKRCYNEKQQLKQPTYKDVIVCEEWHNFQNFAKWYKENYIKNFHLDKDILSKYIKTYSPEFCRFIPQEINNLFTVRQNDRGEYPIGVRKSKSNRFEAQISINRKVIYLGTFDIPEEAFEVYKTAKEKYIKEVAEK